MAEPFQNQSPQWFKKVVRFVSVFPPENSSRHVHDHSHEQSSDDIDALAWESMRTPKVRIRAKLTPWQYLSSQHEIITTITRTSIMVHTHIPCAKLLCTTDCLKNYNGDFRSILYGSCHIVGSTNMEHLCYKVVKA